MPGEESDVEGGDSAEAEAEAGAGPESSEETDAEITSALADYVEGLSSSERRELSAAVEDKLAVGETRTPFSSTRCRLDDRTFS